MAAHRFAWLLQHGDLKSSDVIMHVCDNPPCVNIHHLRHVTHADNVADKIAKGRDVKGSRHYMSRLMESDVIAIRASKKKYKDIAVEYGVSPVTISNIMTRTTWKHI